ncbi:unnamed protein product, partial [Didymodactylos carnosus]
TILVQHPKMSIGFINEGIEQAGPTFFNTVYIAPWCRISPYACGLLTGFLIVNVGRKYPMNIFVKVIGSISALIVAFACLFALYGDSITPQGLSRTSLIVYQSLSRTGW